MLNIALIGATGRVGSRVRDEALRRGHAVTALSVEPQRITEHGRLKVVQADAYREDEVARAAAGHDAVVSAFSPPLSHPDFYNVAVAGNRSILAGVRRSGVKRMLLVGGASSLKNEQDILVLDMPTFPEPWKASARAGLESFRALAAADDLEWTVISPALSLVSGARTGRYQTGGDHLLYNGEGKSIMSFEDLAVAIVDEIETPKHIRQRFAVGDA
jgi:putative NADH-flavin reductase